ncbi:hypothetical protein BDZ45DRAFT_733987 [Acephala macrosclerotiorum]|nr:hypothetical protein BDZ45DRAFT_733987 [Acephala macrosclerotiorum]
MSFYGRKVPSPKELREQIIPRDFGTMETEIQFGKELEPDQVPQPTESSSIGISIEKLAIVYHVEEDWETEQRNLDDEEKEMSSKGLVKLQVEDYTSEIRALSMNAFREPPLPVPPPKILTYAERRARALKCTLPSLPSSPIH